MTFERFAHAKLNASFEALLTDLNDFQQRVLNLNESSDRESELKALQELYQQMLSESPKSKADIVDERSCDIAFVEGVIRAMRLHETIVDDTGIVDTFGSQTLGHFVPDFLGGESDRDRVLDVLQSVVSLDDSDIDRLIAEFERDELSSLSERKSVIDAVGTLYDLSTIDGVESVFVAMYPKYPVHQGIEISAIRTATSLFFCVPFGELRELSETDAKASDDPLANLWGRIIDLRQRDMAHFPVFGFFKGERVAPELLEALSEETGLSPEKCADALTTMVSILPAKDVDKYIVHDAWGHQWQALLFAFEDTYKDTAFYRHPPELDAEHGGVSLRELLTGSSIEDWNNAVTGYLSSEVEERLIRSVAGLFAEVLADAMEYKFLYLRPDLADAMPSSSFLKHLPAKLDLTLHDLPIYIRFAFRGLIEIADDAFPHKGDENWERLRAVVRGWAAFEKGFAFDLHGDSVLLSAHAQLALQFYELVVAYNEILLDDSMLEDTSPMFARHFDILVFTTAAFFEGDRSSHFWQIDGFIRDEFASRYHAFQEALRQEFS